MTISKGWTKKILDHGYLKLIDSMGTDETIVESARMSTGKGFLGWYWEEDTYADSICTNCRTQHLVKDLPWTEDGPEASPEPLCTNCWNTTVKRIPEVAIQSYQPDSPKLLGKKGQRKDLSLLETLLANRHSSPFEMCELAVEVYAPIMVYREWHRHRVFGFSEFSARYSQMPNVHYVPELARIQKQSTANKQGSAESMSPAYAEDVVRGLKTQQAIIYDTYDSWVRDGVAKEVARINTPVSRYSKMRAKTDLRNWLGFLSLRMDLAAQHEIQQYAIAVAEIIRSLYPKTYDLFLEHEFLAVKFSRSEMRLLRKVFARGGADLLQTVEAMGRGDTTHLHDPNKVIKSLQTKLTDDKEFKYAHIPGGSDVNHE